MQRKMTPDGILFDIADKRSADDLSAAEGELIFIEGIGVGVVAKSSNEPTEWSRMQDIFEHNTSRMSVALFAEAKGGYGMNAPSADSFVIVRAVLQTRGGALREIRLRFNRYLKMDRTPTFSYKD